MRGIQDNLIFDVGMNNGEDTAYYLRRGFRVVGIDADPKMIELVKAVSSNEITNNQLTLLNLAVSDKENEDVDFYLSEDPQYNSLIKSMTNSGGTHFTGTIKVKTRTLGSLFNEYGVPYYCKIDIQGYDAVLLETLLHAEQLPKFISVESEGCIEHASDAEEQSPETLERLNELGYEKFKLVDQASLTVLKPKTKFYGLNVAGPYYSIENMLLRTLTPPGLRSKIPPWLLRSLHRRLLSFKFDYEFHVGSSGPFGDDLDSKWLNYEEARETSLYHKRDYFDSVAAGWISPSNGFWCDWHSKLK